MLRHSGLTCFTWDSVSPPLLQFQWFKFSIRRWTYWFSIKLAWCCPIEHHSLGSDTVVPGMVEASRRTGKGDPLVQGLVISFCRWQGLCGGNQREHLPVLSATDICSLVLEGMGSDTKDPIWSSVTVTIIVGTTEFFILQYLHSSVVSCFGVQV